MEERTLLIITEMMIPKLYALQVYRKLQMLTGTKNIPYVIVSRLKNEDTIKSTYALGINYYLKKPYLIVELIGIIKNLIRGNEVES